GQSLLSSDSTSGELLLLDEKSMLIQPSPHFPRPSDSFDFTRSNNYFRLSDAHVSFRFNDASFCAVGDAVIMQFVNGTGKHVGIRVDYSTAAWLNTERSNQFIVQAYIKGLDYIDLEASSCPLSQDRLLLPIDRSDKVTCTKLQSFIEELKQLIYFTTHMVIVVITKLTFQIVSTGDGGSSWRPRCHQRLSRLLLLQYHWLQFYCKRSLSFLLSKLIHVSIFLIVTRTLETAPPHHLIYFKCIQSAFLLRAIFDWHFFKNS
ncbi:unnamed protein product, partial [Brassica napus]